MLIKRTRIPITDILIYGFLPNFLKKLVYRLKGYKIGKKVNFSLGSVVIGKNVEIGDKTGIGFLTVLRGRDIKIGKRVSIGTITFIDTPYIEIGDGTVITEQVFVGGLESKESKLIIGKNATIMQMSYVNTVRPVYIGDDTGIGGHCLIFSHGVWLNKFEGYPVDFAPVEIGNSVWLPWRVFVMPGVKIGDGSVIGANSLVTKNIPAKSLAVGAPAKVILSEPNFPRTLSHEDKKTLLKEAMEDMGEHFKFYDIKCEQ
ncbi:DapH/DapD/GlmU-related protein, partial [candidate division KSB1 bacterium]